MLTDTGKIEKTHFASALPQFHHLRRHLRQNASSTLVNIKLIMLDSPCMINHILGLKQQELQVNAWFHWVRIPLETFIGMFRSLSVTISSVEDMQMKSSMTIHL